MATDEERLVVLLEARIRDFERNMQKAERTATGSYQKMRRQSGSATRDMERDMVRSTTRINQALATTSTQIGVMARTFAGGFAGGIFAGGLAGAVQGVRGMVRQVAALGDEAARAGVTTQVFQEWKALAEDTRIPLDAMVDAFKELNIRADEFATTGKGSAAEAFDRLGLTPEEVQQKLRDPAALMLELIERTQRLKDTAAGTRIFDELFGGTGAESMVRLLEMSNGEIRNIIDSAHEAGRIFDDEMIDKADEMDRRWNRTWANFEAQAQTAVFTTVDYLDDIGAKIDDIGTKFGNNDFFMWLLGGMNNAGLISLDLNDEMLNAAAGRANVATLESRGEIGPTALPRIETNAPPSSRGGGSSRDKAASDADREREAIAKLIDELMFEQSLIGMTNIEREQAIALRKAGAAATPEQARNIMELVAAIETENAALEANKQAQEQRTEAMGNLFRMGEQALLSMIDNSLDAEDAIRRLVVQLAAAAAQAALLNTGPLAGLFGGGLLGGGGGFTPNMTAYQFFSGFSEGTANTGGRRGQPRGIVHGQEAVIPLPNNGKVPVQINGGGASTIEVRLSAELVGQILQEAEGQSLVIAQRESQSAAGEAIKSYDRVLPSRVSFINSHPKRR